MEEILYPLPITLFPVIIIVYSNVRFSPTIYSKKYGLFTITF